MTKLNFIVGQRWVSSTEPEAGLGIVVDCVDRRVEISFPAIGEHRIYALDNAPLNRVQYTEGDDIRCDEGRRLIVTAVYDKGGRFVYRCQDSKGRECHVDELNLDSFVHFSKPQDRLFSGQIDSRSRFKLRRETIEHQRRLQQSGALGLLGARAQLLPHQFYIASEVAGRHAPRVLLADEVGLGKTIEAGLIIHQQLVSGRAGRVLIVVPDSLVHQWLVEMLRRFNLMFTILDEERCQGLEEGGDSTDDDLGDGGESFDAAAINPFDSAQLVICSLSFLVADNKRQQQACAAGWDLMVVDEAHHLSWRENQVSPQYQCVETLAARVQGLLLLTATPEQLGVESHFARLKLLDPARYHSLEQFRAEEASYRQVSLLVEKLLGDDVVDQLRLSSNLLDELKQYLGEDASHNLMTALDQEHEESREAIT
ncbi:MAG: SNF2-related protein, partial [Porticoccaceae bacterium]|nr:SNF2-related protein [Porticoccaceae bacterium]